MFKSKKMVPQSKLPEALQQQIYQDQGNHYQRFDRYDPAISAYKKSLELNSENFQSAHKLADSYLIVVEPNEALKELKAKFGLENYDRHVKVNLTECDCYYDLNEFEWNIMKLSEKRTALKDNYYKNQLNKRNYQKISLKKQEIEIHLAQRPKPFVDRLSTVSKNFEETIGKAAGNCLKDQKELFDLMQEKYKKSSNSRKEMKSNDQCDAASVLNLEVKKKHIKDAHWSEQMNKYLAQVYLKESAEDHDFIGQLLEHPVLSSSKQNKECIDKIQDLLKNCNKVCWSSINMLHARSPIYTYKNQMFPNKSDQKKYYRSLGERARYQTTREMLNQLEKIQKLRESRNLKGLIRYVEVVLGNFYQIKTDQEMPRKNEFVSIICQQVGLAYLDQLKLHQNLENLTLHEQLQKIFSTPSLDKVESLPYVFGDIRTYQDPEAADASFIEFKRKLTYLENRISHSILIDERCHLYHEMAKQNLIQFKFDEVRTFGRKIIDEAKKFSNFNYVWYLLGIVVQIKADIMQSNNVKIMEDLQIAREIVEDLGDQELGVVFEKAFKIADSLLQETAAKAFALEEQRRTTLNLQ